MRATIGMVFGLAACGPDLPTGWEAAAPVQALSQTACAGNPYEGPMDERVEGTLGADTLEVAVRETHFRCAQDVEAYWVADGSAVEVLVQPVDMNPDLVAACDCLYDLDIAVGDALGDVTEVSVYRRWDNLNDDNGPVAIGTITAE